MVETAEDLHVSWVGGPSGNWIVVVVLVRVVEVGTPGLAVAARPRAIAVADAYVAVCDCGWPVRVAWLYDRQWNGLHKRRFDGVRRTVDARNAVWCPAIQRPRGEVILG